MRMTQIAILILLCLGVCTIGDNALAGDSISDMNEAMRALCGIWSYQYGEDDVDTGRFYIFMTLGSMIVRNEDGDYLNIAPLAYDGKYYNISFKPWAGGDQERKPYRGIKRIVICESDGVMELVFEDNHKQIPTEVVRD